LTAIDAPIPESSSTARAEMVSFAPSRAKTEPFSSMIPVNTPSI